MTSPLDLILARLLVAAEAWDQHYAEIEDYGMSQLDHGNEEYDHRMVVMVELRALLDLTDPVAIGPPSG